MYNHKKGTMVFLTPTHFIVDNLHPDITRTSCIDQMGSKLIKTVWGLEYEITAATSDMENFDFLLSGEANMR